ncbi:MAG: SDR family NAD(P)-dependent oxidoreductase [Rhizobiaceae bacterium]|nr:SDR family NAD(P)-dependent oxidoreductase [Rhizobiaceae bacterium]
MALYSASPKDGVAWITGASTGIGRALAIDLAREGYVVAVTARDEENLTSLVAEVAGASGRIVAFPSDVTDEQNMARTVEAIERDAGPIVLAVFNAGNYFPTRPQRLESLNFSRTFEVNVMGVIYGLVPAVEKMRERKRGHVVVVGSVTAYFGWPATAAYGASKAALFNLAESLKYDFDRMNIRIQVVNPGFVDTPMVRMHKTGLPAVMPVAAASRRIVAALGSNRFETTFPRRFTWFLKLLRILPQPLRFWFVNRATGWNRR